MEGYTEKRGSSIVLLPGAPGEIDSAVAQDYIVAVFKKNMERREGKVQYARNMSRQLNNARLHVYAATSLVPCTDKVKYMSKFSNVTSLPPLSTQVSFTMEIKLVSVFDLLSFFRDLTSARAFLISRVPSSLSLSSPFRPIPPVRYVQVSTAQPTRPDEVTRA